MTKERRTMKNRNSRRIASLYFVALCAVVTLMTSGALAWGPPDPPDLTKGETKGIDMKHGTYNLGSTGLRGWIYHNPAHNLDMRQGRTTLASRQILVTHVGAKSPADGTIKVNDVILGVNGKLFASDARKSIARAIQEAEKTANRGVLKLIRWRAGKTAHVQIKLRVMGSYSATAPYNCLKSKRIFEDACKLLADEPLKNNLWGAINGLALLASGKAEYLPKVRAFAREIGPKTLELTNKKGMVTWQWGYKTLFLCEYYLLTGDKEVGHAIEQYTIALARGQGMYGTFGHGLSGLRANGRLHGSVPPYGPVNAAGLVGNLAIVMGKKCGVRNREIDPAIERASKFFGYFVDKGAIPYGEHVPWPYHGSNGKTAQAAMLFAVQGERIKETRFFAKMATASYNNREYGHTGQGFSFLWGALGANTGGPAAAAAYFKQTSWRFDLARRCDGSFTYDGREQHGPGKTHDDTYYGRSSYNGLSPNATYVLTYSLPLKKLYITGKNAKSANRLNSKDVANAIAAGSFDLTRKNMSAKQLIAAFGDWSPIVRGWAAEELARRAEAKALIPTLIKLAGGDDVHVAQGACETLGYLKATEALPVMVKLLKHKDRWLRYKSAEALANLRDAAKPALDGMLQAVVDTAEPIEPIAWDDPIQFSHGQLAKALFRGLLRQSIKDVDPKVLYPAIRAIVQNPDGRARGNLSRTFEHLLTLEDVKALAPELLDAITVTAPADTMFRDAIRMGAFKALAKYHFKEGIQAGVMYAKTQGGHGSESRTGRIMKVLVTYGAAARPAIPGLRDLIDSFNQSVARREFSRGKLNNRRIADVEAAIKAIETAKDQPKLRSIPKK
jgi:HEAT repeat protein